MASGWASDDAVNQQIESTIADAIKKARVQSKIDSEKESKPYCEECGAAISEARRRAIKGVQYCLDCQNELEHQQTKQLNLYNRRGSKDSQLR